MKLIDLFIQLLVVINLKLVGIVNPAHAEKAKRMIFLMSLSSALMKEGIIKTKTLDSLNAELKLANDPSILLIGKELDGSIWDKKDLKKAFEEGWYGKTITEESKSFLSISEIDHISQKIANDSPQWIKYDTDKMHKDIRTLLIPRSVHNLSYS